MNIEGSYSPHGKQEVHFRGSHDCRGIKQLQPSEIKKKNRKGSIPSVLYNHVNRKRMFRPQVIKPFLINISINFRKL